MHTSVLNYSSNIQKEQVDFVTPLCSNTGRLALLSKKCNITFDLFCFVFRHSFTVTSAGFELMTILPQSPRYWDDRHEVSYASGHKHCKKKENKDLVKSD